MKLRKLRNNNNASLTFFFIFILLAITLLTLFAIAIPMLITVNAEFYEAGQDIIDMANDDFTIKDSEVGKAVADAMGDASDSTADQIKILSGFYQYSWLIIVVIITFIIFIIARSQVEVNTGSRIV